MWLNVETTHLQARKPTRRAGLPHPRDACGCYLGGVGQTHHPGGSTAAGGPARSVVAAGAIRCDAKQYGCLLHIQ